MYELKVETDFAAAHQLAMVGEKCENLHGHNWKIEVIVAGETLDEGGVVMDFGIIKQHVRAVMETLDHKFLNELEIFSDAVPPSSENIARYIADSMQKKLDNPAAKIARVSAWESKNACATYIP
ncbi:MAG: 6-carboxytetrahydropterin synthase QueD [Desulfobacterales bacterium]|nr:6-carboxytetrahydropterin synthase QueD [Desulfobacterales bacterium]